MASRESIHEIRKVFPTAITDRLTSPLSRALQMRFWVPSQLPRLRIGIQLDYSVAHGPESLPLAGARNSAACG